MKSFSELGLSKPIVSALEELGFTKPTEIQQNAIEPVLAGYDIIASAQTGSGKTAAFGLPILEILSEPDDHPRALVIVPTRELCLQVETEIKRFGKNCGIRSGIVYGGTGYESQAKALKKGVDIIVATPGRLLDCVERRMVNLSKIEILVLDEADRLMDMGFMPQVRRVVSKLSKDRQTLMFSATVDERMQRLASEFLNDPVMVKVNGEQIEPAAINQQLMHVHEFSKDELLVQLLSNPEMSSVLIFTRTKRKATWVKDRLCESAVAAEEIHGDLSQKQRELVISRYRKKAFPVLVATDVAARGLDIPFISHVINYDLPQCPEDYVHRIGRTGRAGRSGVAISFVSDEDRHLVRDIERVIGRQLDPNRPVKKTQMGFRRFSSSRSRRAI